MIISKRGIVVATPSNFVLSRLYTLKIAAQEILKQENTNDNITQ